jgi:hypothetical protein
MKTLMTAGLCLVSLSLALPAMAQTGPKPEDQRNLVDVGPIDPVTDTTVVGTIAEVNPTTETVIITGPNGLRRTYTVQTNDLRGLQPGDQVTVSTRGGRTTVQSTTTTTTVNP